MKTPPHWCQNCAKWFPINDEKKFGRCMATGGIPILQFSEGCDNNWEEKKEINVKISL
jgi:hypothetical protein